MRPALWGIFLVACVTIYVYSPVWSAGFLSWDDDYNIFRNPYFLVGPWWRLWQQPWYGLFVPLTSTVWWALFSYGDGEPWPFRALNLALHLTNTGLIFLFARKIARRMGVQPASMAALATAAIFALHPLQVGAVAWISGGRDLMSATFGLLAVAAILSARAGWAPAIAAHLLFSAALLAKPQAAALPLAVLAYVAVFERDRLGSVARRIAPWLLLSGLVAVITSRVQGEDLAWTDPLWSRPLVMMDAYGFHLIKSLVPLGLTADYGRVPSSLMRDPATLVPTGIAFAAVVGAALGPWRPGRLLLVWLALLLPVSGVLPFGYQQVSTVADHYDYLAIASLALVAASAALGVTRSARQLTAAGIALTGAAFTLATLAHNRTRVWADDRTFFLDIARSNPSSHVAATALGTLECLRGGDPTEGLAWLEKAMVLRPDNAVTAADYGGCLLRLGRHEDILRLERATDRRMLARFDQSDLAGAAVLAAWGGARFYTGDFETAHIYFCQSAVRDPARPEFRANAVFAEGVLRALGRSVSCGPRRPFAEFVAR